MPSAGSRKRAAPGASPVGQNQQGPDYGASQMANNQFANWDQDTSISSAPPYPDPSGFNPPAYNGQPQTQATNSPNSNQLTRRPMAQSIMRAQYNNQGMETWPVVTDETPHDSTQDNWVNDDDDELEKKAIIAKRDLTAARKQIPPFIQKLSSFLDQDRNTDLITWSTSGDSFIVLDEDEFAKTLIPELFKHNNYASFVRQLNMYGFHKKVGLSDNSMRASERKNKAPSEYYNPYFKRGRTNLLWLITKPKNAQGKGKGGGRQRQDESNVDDDAEDIYEIDSPAPLNNIQSDGTSNFRQSRRPLMIGQSSKDVDPADLAAVQKELQAVRQQQSMISNMIQKVRQEHQQLYGQAAAYQELHNRHENSINAILTFLATVYNRSLDGNGLAQMFAGAIPTDSPNQANVVNLGDYGDQDAHAPTGQLHRKSSRRPLLLKAPPAQEFDSDRITAATPSSNGAPSPQQVSEVTQSPPGTQKPSRTRHRPETSSGIVREVYDPDHSSARPSVNLQKEPFDSSNRGTPEQDIMSLINSANASSQNSVGNRMDFPQALSHLQTADGKSPLSQNQRNNVLQLMASGSAKNGSNGTNNALTSPNPPDVPVPTMPNWNMTSEELEHLEKMVKEQESKVQGLTSMIQPLSPSGSIPGLTDNQNYGNASDFDLDQYLNNGDYFNEPSGTGEIDFGTGNEDTTGNINFDFGDSVGDGAAHSLSTDLQQNDAGGLVESINTSEATSPANTIDEGGDGGVSSPRKRRRRI